MHLIIDGYNLLYASSYSNRESLIQSLKRYHVNKGHNITLVLDGTYKGTPYGSEFHEAGIHIVYTPLKVTADDWIDEHLKKINTSGVTVISSDKKVQRSAERFGAIYIPSNEFSKKITSRTDAELHETPPWLEGRDDENEKSPSKKKGPSRKLSKKERQRRKKMNKL